jgi:hypothetical protein
MSDRYPDRLARLYEQEKMERDERRGLEVRATGFISALLVAAGLAVNGNVEVDGTMAVLATVCAALAMLMSVFPLIGLHTAKSETVWGPIFESLKRKPASLPLQNSTIDAEVRDQHARVVDLVRANASAVTYLRIASLFALFSACSLMLGVFTA